MTARATTRGDGRGAFRPGPSERREENPSMPQVTPADAAQKLIKVVQAMDLDDLSDAHNELFPETPIPKTVLPSEGEAVRKKVLDYLAKGVAVEELIDLW